ncbi:hypothetical protein [Leeuwenhoekiella nanhaiensis]|uniref:Uncharacterized protein n=1 Tax=Leeuwenhoekiella nanhaiensis TaxID=1655491 RepID=A0A2G1VVU1_9FLAO|nr:hypothetical protein [Leeuwenhoekiella nanhaiensis]PHQ30875.1 hypothetical protein CJ305_01195 [Leeuwenhoekiella nanhaiensis]
MYKKLITDLKGEKYPTFQTTLKWEIEDQFVKSLIQAKNDLDHLRKEFDINSGSIQLDFLKRQVLCKVEFIGTVGCYGLETR